ITAMSMRRSILVFRLGMRSLSHEVTSARGERHRIRGCTSYAAIADFRIDFSALPQIFHVLGAFASPFRRAQFPDELPKNGMRKNLFNRLRDLSQKFRWESPSQQKKLIYARHDKRIIIYCATARTNTLHKAGGVFGSAMPFSESIVP